MNILFRCSFLPFNCFPNVLYSSFVLCFRVSCESVVVIGRINGRMCKFGFFFVNLRNLTSVRLQQFILVENWLSVYIAAYLSLFNSGINYTKQTSFPLGKNASMGFSFSDNVRKKRMFIEMHVRFIQLL